MGYGVEFGAIISSIRCRIRISARNINLSIRISGKSVVVWHFLRQIRVWLAWCRVEDGDGEAAGLVGLGESLPYDLK